MLKAPIFAGKLQHATGIWYFICSDAGLHQVMREKPDMPISASENYVKAHEKALLAMLNGEVDRYPLPLAIQGTAFQQSVWKAISQIGFGQTTSYQQLATQLSTKAVRAVGSACGANPVPIAIPCHRVLRTNGELGGFAFGLPLKKQLLAHEKLSPKLVA